MPASQPNTQQAPTPPPNRVINRATTLALILLATILATHLPAQDFSQPPQTKPAPETSLIQQANDALAAGDLPTALKLLTTLNTQTPDNPQVLYDLGLTTEALADTQPTTSTLQPATATSWYRKSIDANPLFAPPYVALGLLLARTNHPAEARAQLTTVLTIPDVDPALKARALRALARLDESANPGAASTELLQAIKLSSEAPDDILLAAEIAEAMPDLPAAEQAYRRYLNHNPQDVGAIASLAHILLAQHHAGEAEDLLTPALAAHPGDPTLTAQLAAAYLASSDPTKPALAAPLLETLHTAHPEDVEIGRLLARVYAETGHLDQADQLYATLLAAQSQPGKSPDPTLVDDRAEVLIRLHRPGEAETILKQAVANPAAFPTPAAFGEAATHLAFAASEIDDPKGALQALTLRSTVLPPSPSTLFLEATANDTLHQSVKAVDLYQKFLAVANGNFPEQELQARQRLAALEHRK